MNPILFNYLLSRYRSSPSAVTKLYEYYYPLIVRYIDRQFRGKVDGKDIAQQFFVKLFEIKPKFIRAPTAWVYTVVRNMALDKLRKDKRFVYSETENIEIKTVCLFGNRKYRNQNGSSERQGVAYVELFNGD